ncbi:MAG: hypothetical protein QME66_13565 [Candidatus Eisenbacteria bacterium]|nr:hypothetical protein [Candidatus Eisenbacteria bacterium]
MHKRGHGHRVLSGLAIAAAIALTTVLVGCSVGSPDASVDRTDAEAVPRAYFDAWERGDWEAQWSYMAPMYADSVPEPVSSLEVLEITLDEEPGATRRAFSVSFEIVVRGGGVTMTTDRYDWMYEFTWDEERSSWIITNCGWG